MGVSVLETLKVRLVGRWKSGRIENMERLETQRDGKNFNFSSICLVAEVEKWDDRKCSLFGWVESKRIENIVCINLFSCPSILIKNNFLITYTIFFFKITTT